METGDNRFSVTTAAAADVNRAFPPRTPAGWEATLRETPVRFFDAASTPPPHTHTHYRRGLAPHTILYIINAGVFMFCNNVLACMEALVQTQPVQQLQHRLWHLEPKSRAHKQGARTQHRAKCVGRRGQGKRKTEGEKGSM